MVCKCSNSKFRSCLTHRVHHHDDRQRAQLYGWIRRRRNQCCHTHLFLFHAAQTRNYRGLCLHFRSIFRQHDQPNETVFEWLTSHQLPLRLNHHPFDVRWCHLWSHDQSVSSHYCRSCDHHRCQRHETSQHNSQVQS